MLMGQGAPIFAKYDIHYNLLKQKTMLFELEQIECFLRGQLVEIFAQIVLQIFHCYPLFKSTNICLDFFHRGSYRVFQRGGPQLCLMVDRPYSIL